MHETNFKDLRYILSWSEDIKKYTILTFIRLQAETTSI